jgi:hypothetical protein
VLEPKVGRLPSRRATPGPSRARQGWLWDNLVWSPWRSSLPFFRRFSGVTVQRSPEGTSRLMSWGAAISFVSRRLLLGHAHTIFG